jgi:NAD(P)-dependent dehydrogenase (short-subunit alcohol dehydrogenase family)
MSDGDAATRFALHDRVALVTGGSRGLGRAICLALAAAGADVVVTSRDQSACEEVAAQVRHLGRRALAYGCHVGRWNELDGLVDAAYEHFGKVDVLVNNAGKSPQYDRLTDVSEAMFDSVVGLNLKGPFRLASLVGTRMAEGGGGSIINISSVTAIRPDPAALPYAAAKAGLDTLTVGLAQALAPKVRVNAILPGAFRTDVSKHWSPATWENVEANASLGRVGEPDEICGTVLYLASDASSFTTGSLLRVDGGIA